MKTTKCTKCERDIRNNNYNRHYESCNGVFFTGSVNYSKKSKSIKTRTEILQKARDVLKEKGPIWNKGLTAETNESVRIGREKWQIKYDAGEIDHHRPHTQETKDKLRIIALNSPHMRGVGKRKRIAYNGLMLDSTYELKIAQELDLYNIKWIRPTNPLSYIWTDGLLHNYFPDFYLPDYNVYLEPKNDYLIEKGGGLKIELVCQYNNINVFLLRKHELTWNIIQQKIKDLSL